MRRYFFLIFIFLILTTQLFAKGKGEEPEIKTQNDEWVLCITQFDGSSLPPEKESVTAVVMRELVERIRAINTRSRISPEFAYYEETAWARSYSDAAKALAAKQNERSLLVYRGDPGWRYRRSLAAIDAQIEELRAALEEAENNTPVINREPVFSLTADNLYLSFPASPASGNESRFCRSLKADAFLAGTITDFYGRFLVTLRLYAVFSERFIWEESFIFSHEDIEIALDEITRKMFAVLSGRQNAAVSVKTQPEDTLVLINRSFAGRGEIDVLELPPGTVTITASAPDHESLTFETNIVSGQHTEIEINLNPVNYGNVEIALPVSGSVYHGALYVGESPLTLRLPVNQLEYIEIEMPDGERGEIVFQMPDAIGSTHSMILRTSMPMPEGYVDKARSAYYWTWGGTWIAGIAAWVLYHTYTAAQMAIQYESSIPPYTYNQGFYNSTRNMYYVSMGAFIALGAVAVLDIIFMSRYLYAADKGAAPIAKAGRSK